MILCSHRYAVISLILDILVIFQSAMKPGISILIFLLSTIITFAQTTLNNKKKFDVKKLCWDVEMGIKDPDKGSPFVYDYQKDVMDAAGVDFVNDSESEIARKINSWYKSVSPCNCNSPHYTVVNGSLLKLAMSQTFTDFILDWIAWELPLNEVDKSDHHTALDYCADQLMYNKDGPLETKYQKYFDMLRKHGAKLASEL